MTEAYKILAEVERDQLHTVSSNANTRVHRVKLGGGKFETHERRWLLLLQIAVEVKFYIAIGKSGEDNEKEKCSENNYMHRNYLQVTSKYENCWLPEP